MSLQKLTEQALQDGAVRAEYDKLTDEFELIDKLITMRSMAGLTQEALADRHGTKKATFPVWSEAKGTPTRPP